MFSKNSKAPSFLLSLRPTIETYKDKTAKIIAIRVIKAENIAIA